MEEKIEIERAINPDRISQSKEIKRILYADICRSTFSFLERGCWIHRYLALYLPTGAGTEPVIKG